MGTKSKAELDKLKSLLSDTVVLLCRNGLQFKKNVRIQGLLGITLDESEVYLIQLNELFGDFLVPHPPKAEHPTPGVKPAAAGCTAGVKEAAHGPGPGPGPGGKVACGCKRKAEPPPAPPVPEKRKPGRPRRTRSTRAHQPASSDPDPLLTAETLPTVLESLSRHSITETTTAGNPGKQQPEHLGKTRQATASSSSSHQSVSGRWKSEIDLTGEDADEAAAAAAGGQSDGREDCVDVKVAIPDPSSSSSLQQPPQPEMKHPLGDSSLDSSQISYASDTSLESNVHQQQLQQIQQQQQLQQLQQQQQQQMQQQQQQQQQQGDMSQQHNYQLPGGMYAHAQPREIVPMMSGMSGMSGMGGMPGMQQFCGQLINPYVTTIQDPATGALIQVSQAGSILPPQPSLPPPQQQPQPPQAGSGSQGQGRVGGSDGTGADMSGQGGHGIPQQQQQQTQQQPQQQQHYQQQAQQQQQYIQPPRPQSTMSRPGSTPVGGGNPFFETSPMKTGGFGFSFGAPDNGKLEAGGGGGGEKKYTCAVCGMTFSQEHNMLWHQRMHDADKLGGNEAYTCDVCGAKFASLDSLGRHIKHQHSGGTKSKSKKKLLHKIPKHDGKLGDNICPICGICFGAQVQLLQHQCMINAKEYQCSFCGKTFHKTRSLQRHIRNHHPAAEYQSYQNQVQHDVNQNEDRK